MRFSLDKTKIQGPAPGTFEANILRTIAVPYQRIDVSGGQYPPAKPASQPAPAIVIKLEISDLNKALQSLIDDLTQ